MGITALLEILALVLWRLFWKLYLWIPVSALIVILILRLGLKGKPYRFEIIVMKPGVNEHLERESEDLEFQTEYHTGPDKKTIQIKSDRLYRTQGKLNLGSLWIQEN